MDSGYALYGGVSESGSVADDFREAELPRAYKLNVEPRHLAITFIEKTILSIYFIVVSPIISFIAFRCQARLSNQLMVLIPF